MDKFYWEKYYQSHAAPAKPSLFAKYLVATYIHPGQILIELGCGNGRDASFLGAMGVNVLAVDQTDTEIHELQTANKLPNVGYTAADFTKLASKPDSFDFVYSRFTLHSVARVDQGRTLSWAADALRPGGYLCIEARGERNSLYQKGDPVPGESDAFIYENHYRRFLNLERLDKTINKLGLTTIFSAEERGFAPRGDENDFFIRHISMKN